MSEPKEQCKIIIREGGLVEFVYSDSLRFLLTEGQAKVFRASHVEPNAESKWQADMSPVGGPLLPACDTRAEALAAEVKWLKENYLGDGTKI